MAVIQEIAREVAKRGVRKIRGRVLVDISLYPEGAHEGGTGVVISPIMVNDNVLDATVEPGAAEGAPAALRISPASSYVSCINQVTTGGAASKMDVDISSDVANPDGTHTVTVTGRMPL